EGREVEALGLVRARSRSDHVEAAAPAEFVAHRHHHAARKAGGKGVALPIARGDQRGIGVTARFELCRKTLGVVALGKGDRASDAAERFILLEEPSAFE